MRILILQIKQLLFIAFCFCGLQACDVISHKKEDSRIGIAPTFTHEVLLRHTPVKNQGRSQTCWAYAMLSTMETNIMRSGDSIEFAVNYAIRCLIEGNATTHYLTQGSSMFTTRSTAQTLLNLIDRYGIVTMDEYSLGNNVNTTKLSKEAKQLIEKQLSNENGLKECHEEIKTLLDNTLGVVPPSFLHAQKEYTPHTLAKEWCHTNSYEALTSFTHHPYYSDFVLEVPDNWEQNKFHNLPIDSLMKRIELAVRNGYSVCWEGDISEPGFSFAKGVADLQKEEYGDLSSEKRQTDFEQFKTTDDHAMSIIGIAHDENGTPYYIIKNSWGKRNPYGGLMYVSFPYVKMKTIAVWIKREAHE